MRHDEAEKRAAQIRQTIELQQRHADDDARQNEGRHQESADRLGARKDLAEERVSRSDAERERNDGRAASEDQAHADRRQIVRVAQDLAEPRERQAAWRDGQIGRLREGREHDDRDRQFEKGHDNESDRDHSSPRAALSEVAHAAPAQRRANRLDIQMTPTAMKVRAKESAAPLGQSSSCMNSS